MASEEEMVTDGMQHRITVSPARASAEGTQDSPLEERILLALAQQPWSSHSNLAARLDVDISGIYKACPRLEKEKLIAGRELGVTRRSQRRYVLARRGVMHVTKSFEYNGLVRAALPLTWQMTEEGATRMLKWLPMIESLYEVIPTFWSCGLAKPFRWQSLYPDPSCSSYIWLGEPTLTDLAWLPSGRLHAVATWSFERHGKSPRHHSIPFLWSGLLPQEEYRSRSLRLGSEYIRCARDPEGSIWWDIEPPVCAIGVDQFAAFRAEAAYGNDVQVGSVDTDGGLVWSAKASHSEWTLRDRPPQARVIGHPEAATIEEGPDLVNLGGTREYRVFIFVADFRAATKANLATAFRMSRGAVKKTLDNLTERGLIASVEGHLYATERGREMLAARDRVDVQRLVEVTYLDPNGKDALRERRHDSAVAAAAAAFWGAGIPVVAGWRWVVSWSDGQLVPDLWMQLPLPGREEGIWVAVEIEFSAKTETRIDTEKLRSFRLAPIRLNRVFPVVVITGEALAAKRFDDLAGDLPMVTTTLREFLTGVWEGPDSVWRRKGLPVRLSDIATEYWAGLWQQTGQSLNFSKPSPDVLARFLREESIWVDPYTDGFDVEPQQPISAKLPAGTPPVLNEARAEPAVTTPVSAPAPPTRSPAPVEQPPISEAPAIHRSRVLGRINRLVAMADQSAASRLESGDLSVPERLCLRRVRSVISYGALRHYQAEERLVEQSLKRCIDLREEHLRILRILRILRAGNRLWMGTTSETEINPPEAFRFLLKEHPEGIREACQIFGRWSMMVNTAAKAAPSTRTLE